MIVQSYRCGAHGSFELLEPCNDDESPRPCPACSEPADYTMSAPMSRVRVAEAIRGKSEEPPPGALDTRPLADGMKMSEWRDVQAKKADDSRRKWIKGLIS